MDVTRGRAAATEPHGLVEACRRGDREAFRALYEVYRDDVYSIALHFTSNEETARDVAQEVFVKLFTAIERFRGESSLRTWIFRLVANACRDTRRRGRRLVPIEGIVAERAVDPGSPEADARERELSLRVRSAMSELAPRIRLTVLLRYLDGLSYGEIAEVLKCSPGTVASQLNRGHRILARRLRTLKGEV